MKLLYIYLPREQLSFPKIMLRNFILLAVLFVFSTQTIFSQTKDTCDSPEDSMVDMNSITKCSVEEAKDASSKNSKRVSIQVSTRRRVIRKRKNSSNSISAINKLENIKKNSSLVGKLDLSSKQTAEKLPFAFVEEKPTFRTCEDVAIVEQPKCFKQTIAKHIKKHFNYPQNSYDASIQGRVLVQFVINEVGDIEDIIARGPIQGEELVKEAKRIVSKLPKLNPGKMNGQNIKVKYGVPIAFKIPGKKPSNVVKKTIVKSKKELGEVYKFSAVEKLPLFKACADKKDNSIDCFNSEMIKHVNKYFAYPQEAVDKNTQGRVWALFVIDKSGNVINVEAKGPEGTTVLEKSSIRLMQKLPKFTPAKHKGVNANVKYAFPITFKLN